MLGGPIFCVSPAAAEANRVVHASSTGRALSSAEWLDDHFVACRPEYEAMLLSAGIQPGWHVLDAGCGSGGYLEVLTDLVGPEASVTSLDLDPEHVAQIGQRLQPAP